MVETTGSTGAGARLWLLLGILALAAYGIFLARHASLAAGGSDTSGYLNNARLLAAGKLRGELRLPGEFEALPGMHRQHFMPLGADRDLPGNPYLTPTYAPGLPLHLAVASKLVGWHWAPLLVELIMALAAVTLCYAIARELEIDPWLAAAGAIVVAAFPVFLFTSIQPLSDTPATTWCLAAAWFALRSRRHVAWAMACGAALGMAVLVRATNVVLLPGLVVLLLPGWRRLGLAVLGGLPGATWLAFYNRTLFGGAAKTGYGDIWNLFALENAAPTLVHFAYWLAVLTPAILLLAALAALRIGSRQVLALALWFGAIVGVYIFYDVSRETWWCLRFILPAVPPLVFLGLLGMQRVLHGRTRIAAGALAAWAVACSIFWTPRLELLQMKDHEGAYAEACRKAVEIVPPGALVASFAASGALYYYTDFPVLRADLIGPQEFAAYAAALQTSGRPIYALLFTGFDEHLLQDRIPGLWTRIAAVKSVGIWRLDAAAPPGAL